MQSADVTATFCATLVDEWVALGVRTAFAAPGSRSTPMLLALADDVRLRLEMFHDERSAAFAALGVGKTGGPPALLLCTSGTAAANFHPAVVESAQAEVPLIVVTADRPPELQGVGAPQTIDQRNLYGTSARIYLDPGVVDDAGADAWRDVARRVFLASTGSRRGPAHLNLPFREPLVGVPGALPTRRKFSVPRRATPIGTEVLSRLRQRLEKRRGVVVAGPGGAGSAALIALAERLRWPVVADPLGGSRIEKPFAVRHADAILRQPAIARRFEPEVILRFGAPPASKVVNAWMRDSSAEVVAVGASPFLIDPDRRVSMHVVAEPDRLCEDVAGVVASTDGDWREQWERAEAAARTAVAALLDDEVRITEPGAARSIVDALPEGARLFVSSSMPVRDVEWYAGSCAHLSVHANRGANGIDGVVSTAVGVALGGGSVTGLLIGDVAFLHDANGLVGLLHRDVDLRIVVVDNRGGGIFSFLPQRETLDEARFERLFGTPHNSDVEALASAHGVPALSVSSSRDLREALSTSGPRVIVVRTDRDENVVVHSAIHEAVRDAVSRVLP